MKTIHIFYNGNEAVFPEGNHWEDWEGQDSLRVFLTCAESWRRNGWDVKRVSTAPKYSEPVSIGPGSTQVLTQYDFPPQVFTGRIPEGYEWYPAPFWQFIAKARTLEPDADGEIWFGTYDVFNFGFESCRLLPRIEPCQAISFQREHFSLSCFVCDKQWLDRAAEILTAYDTGKVPRIEGKYVSDETILRHYSNYKVMLLQAFPMNEKADGFPLVHYARSTLSTAYGRIPVV